MNIVKLAVYPMVFIVLSGCVMVRDEEWGKLKQDIGDLKRDNEDVKKAKEILRAQTDEVNAAIDALKAQLQEIQKAQNTARVEAVENSVSSLEKNLRKKQADIVADITAIRSDFQVLTGRFEEVRYEIQRYIKEGKSSREEVALLYKETAKNMEDLQKRVASLEQSLALLRQEKDHGKEQGKEDAEQGMEQTANPLGFEDAYKDAYETLQKGDYGTAREKLLNYLQQFPDSKYTENAQYWIGESYYGEKDYERAIVEFDNVVKKYPDGAKAPAALLKQGMAFASLGDRKSANAIFKKVTERYPKSEQAEIAKKKLKE